jgi:hypothetical protein
VPKPNVNHKNRFVGIDEPFLSFWHHFGRLDEITLYHDYPNVLYKICH